MNEIEAEHGQTVEMYTQFFDSTVQNARKFADPEKKIKFVGLALQYHNAVSYTHLTLPTT